jgi:hypothetical protein
MTVELLEDTKHRRVADQAAEHVHRKHEELRRQRVALA